MRLPASLRRRALGLLADLGSWAMWALQISIHKVVLGEAILREHYTTNTPLIFVFWHNRILLTPYFYRGTTEPYMLISQSEDGELIARMIERIGLRTLRGSTGRGGTEALKAAVRLLRSGETLGVTPDGPRGPRYVCQGGAVAMAQLSGVPIVPIAVSTTRYLELSSWDRFRVALPFSTAVYRIGEPIHVPRQLTPESFEVQRQLVERRLRQISREADYWAGVRSRPLTSELPERLPEERA